MGTLRVWFNSKNGQDGCTGFHIYRMEAFFFDLSQILVVKIRFLGSYNNIGIRMSPCFQESVRIKGAPRSRGAGRVLGMLRLPSFQRKNLLS
ncbi:MAG: hypothetical protein AB7D51_13160 [Desulfovibrionaceae bacterium]